jgi:hypothetical protein
MRYTLPHHKWGSIKTQGPSTLEIRLIAISSSPVKKRFFCKTRSSIWHSPLNLLQPPQKVAPTTARQPLMIPCPNNEPNIRIPRIPLRRNVNNPHAREAHNYSLVDDLAQSPATMSVLEVLQTLSNSAEILSFHLGGSRPS